MNFGQVHYFFFFSSSFFFLSLQNRPRGHPSRSTLPSLSAFSSFLAPGLCPFVLGHKEGGEPEAILQRFPYSLSLTPSTPDPQSVTSCRPGGAPRPHSPATEPPAPDPLPLSRRRRPCTHPWRQRLRRQASHCCLAISTLWPPSTQPNRCQPPRPAIGPAAALVLTWSRTRRGC
jgi:hypothetical protein